MDFNALEALLPVSAREDLAEIWRRTGANGEDVKICTGGEFSVGKTTLLNNLVGRALLPVALEESTALPTFLEYSQEPFFRLAGNDQSWEISEDKLAQIIVNPPKDARMAQIGVAENWLQGLQLIDLPGTGGTDPVKREYGREMMRQVDAVIYILNSRGPTKSDIENIRFLHTLAKKIFLGVSHWDEVEEAVNRGEKKPDLEAWSRDFELNAGAALKIFPLDKNGRGSAEILDFIIEAVENLANLRKARFRAEALPFVGNLLDTAKMEMEAVSGKSEAETRQTHTRLLEEKEKLLQLRARLIERQKNESSDLLQRFDRESAAIEARLAAGLRDLEPLWQNADSRESFIGDGQALLRQALAVAASLARNLSESYGQMDIPKLEAGEVRLNLAPPPTLEAADFLDMGRYNHLQETIENLEAQANESIAVDPEVVKAELKSHFDSLQELERYRNELVAAPLPQITSEIGKSSGKIIGRMLGEIADLGLIFLAPAAMASKAGTYAAKSAKALGLAAKSARAIGKTAKTAALAAQTAHKAGCGYATNLPSGIVEKLGMLDFLTLGYWGEKIGAAFDGPTIRQTVTDPEALRNQQAELARIDAQIQKHRLETLALERQAKKSAANPLDAKRDIARLRSEMEHLEALAAQKRTQAEKDRQEEYEAMLDYEKNRCHREWLMVFASQARSMRAMLSMLFKNWWDDYLPTVLGEAETRVNDLMEMSRELPEKRKQRENELGIEIENLQKAVNFLV